MIHWKEAESLDSASLFCLDLEKRTPRVILSGVSRKTILVFYYIICGIRSRNPSEAKGDRKAVGSRGKMFLLLINNKFNWNLLSKIKVNLKFKYFYLLFSFPARSKPLWRFALPMVGFRLRKHQFMVFSPLKMTRGDNVFRIQ